MPLYQSSGVPDTVRETVFTTANVVFGSDAAWKAYTDVELDLPAAVGDQVELHVAGMWANAGGGNDFIEWVVVTGAGPTIVRYGSTRTSSPATQGDPAYYPNAGFYKGTGPFAFQVAAGDLDGGNVRFAVAHIGAPGGGTLYADSDYPLRLYAVNKHTVS